MTVAETVLMGLYSEMRWWQAASPALRARVSEALDSVGMLPYAETHIAELSGGQQQRVFLARALVQKAAFYLMDEPFAGVDKVTEVTLNQLFKKLYEANRTVIAVHHDWHTLAMYFDWVVFLNRTVRYAGPIADCALEELVKQTYQESE